ncbi:MAG: ABC transporter ATP-binding protein/permease [Eggerthellaceae bacterium]|jgi:ATP-binding cassette subfamily B protein|nr:ABC transporter ATP-binding protein/permease [Eggerthellaceae bacterium]MDR2715853.1 ABC transporter ATP-binding protein/permease [Coriobacteriaceae bacterium]
MRRREYGKKPSTIARTLRYYWHVTSIQWPMFLLSVASTLGFVFFLSYANPYVVGLVVDKVSLESVGPDRVFDVFGPYIIMLICANVLGQFFSKLQDYTVWKLELRANYALATHVFDTLSNQSMTFHTNRYGGSLVSQTQKFISAYSTLLESLIYAVIPIVSSAVFTVTMLAGLVPLYVAILSVLLVTYVIVAYQLYRRILPLNAAAAGAQNALSGELSDSITNILSVKTYGREAFERTLFDSANKEVLAADSKRMRASIARGAMTSLIIVVIMALVVVFITGGNAWFGISAGTLVMMFTYTYSLTMQFNRINITFTHLNRGFGDAHDMTLILDEPTLVADDPDACELKVTKGEIAIENVTFWYADGSETDKIFKQFSLEIPAGQRVGLVGRSGSGKTTLTTLLLRLSNLQEGRILVDGQDIAHATQVSLRQQIAYVPQEPLLFHRTIRENIAYGKPEASDGEIREAAAKANALEFIEALPQGFDTHTGERGVKLSGGQRQRVAIARAILAAAPILVLDEATSALDSESEKLIQDALRNLMEGRTSIVVAHRLSTVASLDRIIVLREGGIVEDGTHAELVEAGGEYAQLWSRQSGAFFGLR